MDLIKANEIAKNKLKEFCLEKWSFKFDKSKVRFGCCKYNKRLISMSKELVLLNSEEEFLDTLLHEIAHALLPGNNHNHLWRKKP